MKKRGPFLPILLLAVCAIVAVAAVLAPTALLEPLTLHTPEIIERTYRLDHLGGWISLALLPVGLWLFVSVWRRGRRFARSVAAIPLAVLAGAAFFSGEYLVEWLMFEPIETIRFVAAEDATHIADGELVMGVVVDDVARAYPVTMMAYHHIANDRLAGEPYVVTY